MSKWAMGFREELRSSKVVEDKGIDFHISVRHSFHYEAGRPPGAVADRQVCDFLGPSLERLIA